MKKVIAIMFILLISLFILVGCASTTIKPQNDQLQDYERQGSVSQPKSQQQVETEEIPQPPPLPD